MELLAVITGLEALKIPGSNVVIYTDSRYVADSVEKGWVFQWEAKGFRKRKNPDLWIRFLKIYRKHKVKLVWIKGHADNKENELCDRLAVEAGKGKNLSEDQGYRPEEDDENFQFN
jgi:ribonuclease HI